jgi:hypothetical protein
MGCLYQTALLGPSSSSSSSSSISSGGRKDSSSSTEAASDGGGGVDVSTLMAVDTGRAVNLVVSVHALVSLPIQIAAAMYLLYTQVREGEEGLPGGGGRSRVPWRSGEPGPGVVG